MTQAQSTLGSDLANRAVRLILPLVGLLILRAILAALPVLKNAPAFDGSLMSPLVLVRAVVDTLIFLTLLRFGVEVGQIVRTNFKPAPELGKILSLVVVVIVLLLAYHSYQTPAACVMETPADLVNLGKPGNTGLSQNLADVVRVWQEAVQGVTADAVATATGNNLLAYQRLAVAVLRQPPDLYGWTFLILILIPVVGVVAMVSRNRNTFTELILHAAAPPRAPSHGAPASGGTVPGDRQGVAAGDIVSYSSIADRLARLKSLLDASLISNEDFQTQKAAILQGSLSAGEPEELRKLKLLLDAGALTHEEYEIQKQRFLAQL
jgi:Short C-terminal domain